MFYLPRICEHCLNPSCVAVCPSGALYKRIEDGIVLVDQDRCRGWRMCVSGCPYKKIYFNHQTGKAEKCTFCYPRIEAGVPTVCSETCVGRLRYLGRDAVRRRQGRRGRAVADETGPVRGAARLFLDPRRSRSRPRRRGGRHPARLDRRRAPLAGPRADHRLQGRAAAASGVPDHADGLVHPAAVARRGRRDAAPATTARTRATCSAPSTRCASRSNTSPNCSPPATPGRSRPRCADWPRCAPTCAASTSASDATRRIARGGGHDERRHRGHVPAARLAKYEDRYVIPTSYAAFRPERTTAGHGCSLDGEGGPGMYEAGLPRHGGLPRPARSTRRPGPAEPRHRARGRVNLLDWDGRGTPRGLFPRRREEEGK